FLRYAGTSSICPLSLHDALPILAAATASSSARVRRSVAQVSINTTWSSPTTNPALLRNQVPSGWTKANTRSATSTVDGADGVWRSEEHTSELQSRENLVCRLLLE